MTDDAGPLSIDPGAADAAIRFSFVQQGVAAGGQQPPIPFSVDDVVGPNPSRTYHFTVGSDLKIYGQDDTLPDGPSHPMTMTLRVMHGVIDVHSKIFRPDEAVEGALRWDSGSSIVHADLPSDQGKGFESELRNEHRFNQFLPGEGDYLSAVRANIVNLQGKGLIYQFRLPPDETPAPPFIGRTVSTATASGAPGTGGGWFGWRIAVAGLAAVAAIVGGIVAYARYDGSGGKPAPAAIAPAKVPGTEFTPSPTTDPTFSNFANMKAVMDRLGLNADGENALAANLTTLQPHNLFYSDSSKQPKLDFPWLKIHAFTDGVVAVSPAQAATLNQQFRCGSDAGGARTTCSDGTTGFANTNYWAAFKTLGAAIPAADPKTSFIFTVVAADPNQAANYRAMPPFDKDLYNQTKYWYEFGRMADSDRWYVQQRISPATDSLAPTRVIAVTVGDTVLWLIPQSELPAGNFQFNATTFGYQALPPDPATAAVDALADPAGRLPVASNAVVQATAPGAATDGSPASTPTPVDLTAAFAGYLSVFADRFRVRDNDYLFQHLNPAVLQVYGADQCRASLAARKPDATFTIDVQSVTGPAPFDYTEAGRTITVPGVYTVVSSVTVAGQAEEQAQHYAYDNGFLSWFTSCPAPGG